MDWDAVAAEAPRVSTESAPARTCPELRPQSFCTQPLDARCPRGEDVTLEGAAPLAKGIPGDGFSCELSTHRGAGGMQALNDTIWVTSTSKDIKIFSPHS